MALTFFATDIDLTEVWRSLFTQPGMKVFEDYSKPDSKNRWFTEWSQVAEAIHLDSSSLAAWPEPAGGEPRLKQVIFNADTQRRTGMRGRTVLASPALIKVGRNNDQDGCLASASISSWTEKGARQRSIFEPAFLDEVDWKQLRCSLTRVERFIRKSSPAKMRSYPVMPNAFDLFQKGEVCLWNWGEACVYPSPLVVQVQS